MGHQPAMRLPPAGSSPLPRTLFTGHAGSNASLLILIGLLIAALTAEFLPVRPSIGVPAHVGQPLPRAAQSADMPRPSGRTAADDTRTILARPLFSIHRRPPANTSRAEQASLVKLPRLSGIIVAGGNRHAVFDLDGHTAAGGVGDHVGSYTILAIAPRQVTVAGQAGVQVLSLRFGAVQPPRPTGPGILDRMRAQPYRPPLLPSSAALQRLLLRPQAP